jgi:putative DNA primase/helicase
MSDTPDDDYSEFWSEIPKKDKAGTEQSGTDGADPGDGKTNGAGKANGAGNAGAGAGHVGVRLSRARPNDATVTLVSGSDIKPAAYDWLWRDWLARGKLEILAGPVGAAKTTIAIGMAATITSGELWPDGTRATPGDVVVWSGEDAAEDTLMPRLLAFGGDPKRIHFVKAVVAGGKKRAFNPATDMPALIEATRHLKEIAMVLVDPVVMVVAGDSHKNTEVRRGLQPLIDFAVERNVVALGITHLTKGTQAVIRSSG